LFTVSPHVPDNSPVTGSARPKRDVAAVVICLTSRYYFRPIRCLRVTDILPVCVLTVIN
jgi:hypothetical protein